MSRNRWPVRWYLIGWLTLVGGGAKAQQDPLRGLDQYVQRALQEWRTPGAAVAVIHGDSVVYLKGHGIRQLGRPELVDERTIFQIGSLSKGFTTTAMAVLVDEGRVKWDDPVRRHLPWFNLYDPWVGSAVTVRDLLAHRVGVEGWVGSMTLFDRREVARRVGSVKPDVPFRARFFYSNLMYGVASEVVGAAGGMTWDDYLRSRVFEPLNMTSTNTDPFVLWTPGSVARCFDCETDKPASLEDALPGRNLAMPHMQHGDTVLAIPWRSYDNAAGAGGVNSNLVDLANWVRFQLGDGTYQGKRLVSPSSLREMHSAQMLRPEIELRLREDGSSGVMAYGLGWVIGDYRGRKAIAHGGNIWGFNAYIAMLPEEHLGVVVLANHDGYLRPNRGLLPFAVAQRIFDGYLGVADSDPSARLLALVTAQAKQYADQEQEFWGARNSAAAPELPLSRYIGRYESPEMGPASIAQEKGRFVIRFPDAAMGEIEPWHPGLFLIRWGGPGQHRSFASFIIDPTGGVTGLNIRGRGEFVRIN